MRFSLLVLAVLLLGCAPRTAPVAPPDPGGLPLTAAPDAPEGTWSFTMRSPDGTATPGTMWIEADGTGRIAIPAQRIDGAVEDGTLERSPDGFSWRGTVPSPFGPLSFTLTGVVRAGEMTGRIEAEGFVPFDLTATREGA